jgi:hypothetical protein
MYVPKKDFGWNRRTGWLHGDESAYNTCVKMLANRQPGRNRTKPVHPSWEPYDALFNRNDPTRSQGAFCRRAGLATTSVSSAKYKQITPRMAEKISIWIEELEKLEPNE